MCNVETAYFHCCDYLICLSIESEKNTFDLDMLKSCLRLSILIRISVDISCMVIYSIHLLFV